MKKNEGPLALKRKIMWNGEDRSAKNEGSVRE